MKLSLEKDEFGDELSNIMSDYNNDLYLLRDVLVKVIAEEWDAENAAISAPSRSRSPIYCISLPMN